LISNYFNIVVNFNVPLVLLKAFYEKYYEGRYIYNTINSFDLILLPSLILFFLFFSILYSKYKIGKGDFDYKFFPTFLILKFTFGIIMALIYIYIYGYGDSFAYWNDACDIGRTYYSKISLLPFILESDASKLNSTILVGLIHPIMFNSENLFITKIYSFIMPLVGFSYISGTLMVAFFTSFGNWKLYQSFRLIYNDVRLQKLIFYLVLLMPSCILWGSGLLKDAVTFSCLGWLTYSLIQIFYKNHFRIIYSFYIIISIFIIFNLKKYILFAYFPSFIFFIIKFKLRSLNSYLRKILYLFVVGIVVGGFVLFNSQLNEMMGQFAIDKIIETAGSLNYNLSNIDSGSDFSLGITLSTSLSGMLAVFPFAVFATLFRPFLWEVHNLVSIASALESFFFLFFTLYVIRKVSLRKFISNIVNDGMVQFCLVYAIFFSYAVGFSTSNFGTLVRYKIPMMPFYLMGIFIIYYNEVISKGKPSRLLDFFNGKKSK
jgi:hypothetical protein